MEINSVFACVFFIIVQLISCSNAVAAEKPKNISCKIFNFIKMECTWDPLQSSHRTEWKLKYLVCCYGKWLVNLSSDQNITVIWDKDTESPFRMYCEKSIQLIGEYGMETIKSDVIRFQPDYIVELSSVDITNVRRNDSSIYIRWKKTLLERPTVCRVIYAPDYHPPHNKTKYNNSNEIYLTELSPSTLYKIWIRWKLQTSSFWSEEKGVNVITNHEASKSGPVVVQGSYIRHKCFRSNQTCITIYWKPLKASLATTKFYEISDCTDPGNGHRNVRSVDANKRCLEMKSPDFPLNSICIRSNTDVGYSPYSILNLKLIQSAPPKAKRVTVKETKDPETLLVTWFHESNDNTNDAITNVTFLWCHGRIFFTDVLVVDCEDQIDWITVVANGSYRLRLEKGIGIRHFHVAVILNSNSGNRGMTWSECIFTKTGYINDIQVPFIITLFSEKILVHWHPVDCEVGVIPLMYQVAYSRQTEMQQQNPCELGSLVNVSISQTTVELKNLTSNEYYYICTRLVTVVGPTPFSKPFLGKTNAIPRWPYPVDITTTPKIHQIIICLSCIAGILFILICIRYLWICCRFTINIDIPEIRNNVLEMATVMAESAQQQMNFGTFLHQFDLITKMLDWIQEQI